MPATTRQHPWAQSDRLWLGSRGRGPVGSDAIKAMLGRRAAEAGIKGLHAHQFRHTWADQFRKAGGSEGDLMVLGGRLCRGVLPARFPGVTGPMRERPER